MSKAVHVAGDASGTSDSSEAKRMSVSQALQVTVLQRVVMAGAVVVMMMRVETMANVRE